MKASSKDSKGMYGFDPTGLERAAKAAKLLDSSPNSKMAFDLALKEEEISFIKEQSNLRTLEIQQEKLQYENKKQLIGLEIESSKQKALYEDYLAKKRIDYQQQIQKETNAAILLKQEQSLSKQEEEKRATIEHQHNLEMLRDKMKIQNKYSVKAKVERDNFDIVKEKLILKGKDYRETRVQLRSITLDAIGKGIKNFILNKTMFQRLLIGSASAFIMSYAMMKGINLSYEFIRHKLFTPKLIKETSKISLGKCLLSPWNIINSRRTNLTRPFNELFFNKPLQHHLNILVNSLKNINQRHNIPLRNFLFYGPPGTGKTSFAKNLAIHSGMHYAILTGADISPLGSKAVIELNKVFNWASHSRKKVLLFIDESDAFLRKRTDHFHLSEDLRNAINTFLYRTGNQTNHFMFILATNQPHFIDNAVQDRIDEIIHFDSLSAENIETMLEYHAKKYFMKESLRIFRQEIKGVSKEIAKERFSGREIVKWLGNLYDEYMGMKEIEGNGKEELGLTAELIGKVLEKAKMQKRIKGKWEKMGIIMNNTNDKNNDNKKKYKH